MGSQDSFFEALGGETPTGFFTHSTSISIGVDVQGNQIGVRGSCQGPVGDGVQGFGSGNFSGVAGFGGADDGTGVVGFGSGVRGQGLRGIGAGGPNIGAGEPAGIYGHGARGGTGVIGIGGDGPNTGAGEAAGVYGQGGSGSTGVVGRGGFGQADGVRGFGSENFSGVAGFGGDENGTGVVGFGGGLEGGLGQGIRGIGAGGPNIGADEAAGVFGQGGTDGSGVVGFGGGNGVGVRGIGAGGPNIRPNVRAGVYGRSGKSPGTGVVGEGGDQGSGVYGSTSFSEGIRSGVGVFGEVLAGNGIAVFGVTDSPGAFAGVFNGPVQVHGDVTVFGNATVNGLKSAVVPFPDGSNRKLYCMESPESWFEDFGTGYLKNGQAEIPLDAEFASIVNSGDYHVFLSEYDDNNALYVTNRTSMGFGVRSKLSPTATGTFSYRVVAKRKDKTGPRFDKVVLPAKRHSAGQLAVMRDAE